MATVYDRVKKVFLACKISVGDPDAIVPAASLSDDLHIDSLDFTDLLIGLEEEFEADVPKIKLEDEDFKPAGENRVQDVVDALKKKGVKDQPD